MKLVFFKISSVLLSFLVLFSTMSFTVEKHYCGDFLMDVSFTGDADDCGMLMRQINKKKNCCKDELHKIEGQDKLQKNSEDNFKVQQQQFLISFIFTYKDLCKENESDKTVFKDRSPPDIPLNYQVVYQTFLI